MGLTFPITGTYDASKAAWWPITDPGQAVDNYNRWIYAHATVLGDLPSAATYYSKSFNFSCDDQSPDDDDTLRTAAHNAGVADGDPAHGADFLQLGNYVGSQAILSINCVAVPDGLLYWAGQSLADGGSTGPITRGWLEIISTVDLDSLIPLVDGDSYTINMSDNACACTIAPTVDGTASCPDSPTMALDEWYKVGSGLWQGWDVLPDTTYRFDWVGDSLSVDYFIAAVSYCTSGTIIPGGFLGGTGGGCVTLTTLSDTTYLHCLTSSPINACIKLSEGSCP